MFEVGFSEMLVIAVVALVVLGPERLPKVARTLGHLWGRAQRYINGVKADIARDMSLAELREMQQKVQQEADSAQLAFQQNTQAAEQHLQQLNQQLRQEVAAVPAAVQLDNSIKSDSYKKEPPVQKSIPLD